MKMRMLLAAFVALAVMSGTAYAGKFEVEIPDPPPVPEFFKSPPDIPPVPDWVIEGGDRSKQWFFNEKEKSWFYYDKNLKPRYDKKHKFKDDGKHHVSKKGKWVKVGKKEAKAKGWAKKEEKKKKWWKFW